LAGKITAGSAEESTTNSLTQETIDAAAQMATEEAISDSLAA